MKDLIAFYRARLDDEARRNKRTGEPEDWCDRAHGIHHEPEWIDADIASKRAILDQLVEALEDFKRGHSRVHRHALARAAALGRAVRLLATVYADHPDYLREFAPRTAEWDR